MWPNTDEKKLLDEFKGLGLTPAEIKAAIDAKKALETRASKAEEDLKKQKEETDRLNTEFGTIKAKLDEIEANPQNRQAQPVNDGEQPADWTLEPEKAFAQSSRPIAALALQTAAQTAKMAARTHLSKTTKPLPLALLFDHWEAEIDALAKQTPLAALGNPATWIHLFNNVKGTHVEEMMANPTQFMESVTGQAPPRQQDDKKDEMKLTPQEEQIALKMKITPEQYLAQKKNMQFVS